MIKVSINNICAKLVECEPLTSGMIGKTLDVEFSAEWNGFEKTAVFSNGDTVIDVLQSQWQGNTITIPAEVLAVPNRVVRIGIYGFAVENGATVAMPTIYAKIGIPMVGADPTADPTTDPSLPVYAQLQWQIDHFEISDEQIEEQVQAYLAEHPIEISPATDTILGGIKVGEGLSVTADGTLSTEVTAEDIDELAETKQDKLIAGANITIAADGKTISASGGGESYDDTELRGRIATIEGKEASWDGKQNAIADLASIRSGAALGATSVQPADLTDYALKSDLDDYQPKSITDAAGYYTSDTVEGALAEIGAELSGINTLVGSGVIV